MYSGMMIEELVEMVARAEGNAREGYGAEREESEYAPRFVFDLAEPPSIMAGVA